MAKLKSITIENYRSIKDAVTINFPQNMPVILIGENNSGKSNIIRAIDIMFGEYYPKYKDFDDHDYFGRNPDDGTTISINVNVEDLRNRIGKNKEFGCIGFYLEKSKFKEVNYSAIQEDGVLNNYVSNELREELSSIWISSEQNLAYQLSYSSKYTLLSKVTKAFHEKLTSEAERVNKLKELYMKTIEIFDEVEEFKDFKSNMSSLTGEYIQNMTHALELDFSAYDPSNYFKNLRVLPKEDENVRNFDELGSGQQQILALSFAHAYAKCFKDKSNLILLIDEPEAHLHPLAQKWLAKALFKMAEDGLQMVISTHSPYFIDLKYLEGLYIVRKIEGNTKVFNKNKKELVEKCKSTGANKADKNTIIPFYSKSATPSILKGFFANKIILVEGPTEELALPIYFEAVGFDLLKEGIDIINVGGKGELAKWWRLFTLYEIPCYVVFDNDSNNDANGKKRRDALIAIGISDEEIENLLISNDWNIGEKFCVFGKEFESTFRESFSKYSEFENNVKNVLGDSKPLIAREVALKIVENKNEADEGWEKLKEMREKIKNL